MNLTQQKKYKKKLQQARVKGNIDIYDLTAFIVVTWKYCDLWSSAQGRVALHKVYNMSQKKFNELIKDYTDRLKS